jgi:GTPase Era involved in 16S rRNA processing
MMNYVNHCSALPSPWLPADTASDVDMAADLAVEIVREEIFRHIHAELPYELQPIPTESRKLPDGNMMLRQSIFVRTILVGPSSIEVSLLEVMQQPCCGRT